MDEGPDPLIEPIESANGLEKIEENGVHNAETDHKAMIEDTVESASEIVGKDQNDDSVQNLASKLKVALKEIITKDNLVKQHAKVAEDAISGWEKAETEAAMLKQQLDNAIQQKSGLEERIAHLDSALKECMKELRTGKEEHEEITKKAEEWDLLRTELEKKLSEAEERQLAVKAENAAKSDAKSQAESELKKVTGRLESLEKENMNLKHDVRVLKKELVALNNESKKTSETAKQNLADSTRKVTKLEAECQKLKTQLRKKGEITDRRKSLGGKYANSPRAFSMESVDDEMSNRDVDEKCFSLEEETKTLKEELAKKSKELQAAKFMCARTASKLSTVEHQLESGQDVTKSTLAGLCDHIGTLRALGGNQQSSQGSCNGDESDAWASALVAELEQFKKEAKKPDKLLDTTSFELMDDFLEMEKLTCDLPHENGQPWEKKEITNGYPEQPNDSELTRKEKELEAASELIGILNKKVAALENQLQETSGVNGCRDVEMIPCSDQNEQAITHVEETSPDAKKANLTTLVSKIVHIVGELARHEVKADTENTETAFQKLATAGDALVNEKADFISFTEEVLNTLSLVLALQRKHEEDLQAEKIVFQNLLKEEREKMQLEKQELDEKLVEAIRIAEQLRSRIAALEDDVLAAEERAHSTVKGLSVTFEEDLKQEKSRKEAAERHVEELKVVMQELHEENEKLDANAKLQLDRIAVLEEELRKGRLDKVAAQKDIHAVNEDIQKLMAEFVQLEHEKQSLEEQLQKQADEGKKSFEECRVELDRFTLREEALHRSMSEREAMHIEMQLSIEKIKEESTLLITAKEELENKLAASNDIVSSLKEEVSRLELENVRLEDRLTNASESLKTQEAGFISLQNEFYQLKIEKEDMEQNYEQTIQELHSKITKLNEELTKVKTEKDTSEQNYEQSLEGLRSRLTKLNEEKDSIEQEFEQSLEGLRSKLTKLNEEVTHLKTENRDLQENSQLDEAGQIEFLKEECGKMEAELSTLRSLLDTANANIRQLEEECTRLETEKEDLEHVLTATNEIVQGVKSECSRLSNVEEELQSLRADKEELERLANAAEEKIKSISQEMKDIETHKAELEHDLALSQVTWKSQVFEAEELVASLRAELGLSAKSKQLAEEQLAESFSVKAELQYQVKSALHEVTHLEERAKSLEEELEQERIKYQTATQELEDLRRNREGTSTPTVERDLEKDVDLAAKLDECHRAILTLGEQLQSLSVSSLSVSKNNSVTSPTVEPGTSEESINTVKPPKEEPEEVYTRKVDPPETPETHTPVAEAASQENVENGDSAKIFVPSVPLEGRPRSKSASPAKPKISKTASGSSDLSKSFDLGSSPFEKPSSSSAFSRFFRGKSSSHHHS